MKALKFNPVVLILINIIAPSMYILINGKYLMTYLLIFSVGMMFLMGRYKRIIALLAVFFGMIGIHYLTMGSDKLKWIGLFFVVMAQSVPCFALASVLISKYTSAELLSALESLRIPRILVVAVTITIKYIPTFRREFGYIKESMRLRGIRFTMKKPLRSFRYFIVPQLFRCAALAEEITSAGLVKGIDAPCRRTSFYQERMRWYDIAVMIIFMTGIIGGLVWKAT
jgi:energy-coupling factor transport system permease protein